MTKDQIFQMAIETIMRTLPRVAPDMVTPDITLKDLGANSIDRMDIATMTMESVGVRVPMVQLAGAKTVGALTDLLFTSKMSD